MIPLLSKGSLQLLSIAKCLDIIGEKTIYETPCTQPHDFLTRLFNFQRPSSLAITK